VLLLLTVELICRAHFILVILARLLNYQSRSLHSSAQLVELQSCTNASWSTVNSRSRVSCVHVRLLITCLNRTKLVLVVSLRALLLLWQYQKSSSHFRT